MEMGDILTLPIGMGFLERGSLAFGEKKRHTNLRKKKDTPKSVCSRIFLGGGFKHFLFSPLFGEDSQFD